MKTRRKRFRRYEYVEREDRIGHDASLIVRVLEQVERRYEHGAKVHASREELFMSLGDMLASVRQAKEIADRLCWRRIPARRRVIGEE